MTFVGFVQMRQFCDAFRDNNNIISYGFTRIMLDKLVKGNYKSSYYIFIKQSYWTLKTDDQITNVSLEVMKAIGLGVSRT